MSGGIFLPEAAAIKVSKTSVQKALVLLKRLELLNRELKLQLEKEQVHIPLMRVLNADELKELKASLPALEMSKRKSFESTKQPARLDDLLSGKLPSHVLASLPHAIDFIGDIAVVEMPPELELYKQVVGEAILKAHKGVKTVLSKWGAVSGVYRLRTFEVIGGEAQTQTIHQEYGCVFHVDLAKAYFSPRLSYEHARTASLVREGETVIDMFAGVGPFSILIAKKHTDTHVYAIDVNPEAFIFLKKNVVVNRVIDKVTPILGDARQIINERLAGIADRVIMNLPEKAIEYVDVACNALRPKGGTIHYYEFVNMPEPMEAAKSRLAEAIKQTNRELHRTVFARIVRGVAPFTYQVVVDAEIK
jgi:tRNA (guanine37-N1)-methyltransferase